MNVMKHMTDNTEIIRHKRCKAIRCYCKSFHIPEIAFEDEESLARVV